MNRANSSAATVVQTYLSSFNSRVNRSLRGSKPCIRTGQLHRYPLSSIKSFASCGKITERLMQPTGSRQENTREQVKNTFQILSLRESRIVQTAYLGAFLSGRPVDAVIMPVAPHAAVIPGKWRHYGKFPQQISM